MLTPERADLPIVRQFGSQLRRPDGSQAPSLSAWEYLNFTSGLQTALVFGSLFWPTFVVESELVFIREKWRPGALLSLTEQGLSRSEAQRLINHVHVWDLFSFDVEQHLPGGFGALAELLRQSWQAKADLEFPGIGVAVKLVAVPDGAEPELIVTQPDAA